MGNPRENYKELLKRYEQWMRVERGNSETTVYQMMRCTTWFKEWLLKKGLTFDDIDQKVVNDYIEKCQRRYKPNTIICITANLRKLLKHFIGKDVSIRIPPPQPPDRNKTPLSREEVEAMFEAAKDDALSETVLKLFYYVGLRLQELLDLDIQDIDFQRLHITVRHGKNNVARVVNMTRDCAMAIQRYLISRPKPKKDEKALLISNNRTRLSASAVRNMVKKYAAQAGIEKHVYCHLFRITMISHMAQTGLSPREIQAQSGHSDIGTLLGYIQNIPDRIRYAYDKVFEKDELESPELNDTLPNTDEVYKKKVLRRYLDGEIDRLTMNTMLEILEGKRKPQTRHDLAYG